MESPHLQGEQCWWETAPEHPHRPQVINLSLLFRIPIVLLGFAVTEMDPGVVSYIAGLPAAAPLCGGAQTEVE